MRKYLRLAASNAAPVLGSLVMGGVLFEIAVRLFLPQPTVRYRFSPDSFYEPVPGARFVYRRQEFATPIEYNAFGMRDRPRQLARLPGELRIALLGDSFTEGKEVPFDSCFAQVLERTLQERHPRGPVEVLNFGVSGYGTVASTARFRALGARFHPDVVLYLFVDNDVWDNVGKDAQLYTVQNGRLELHAIALGAGRRLRMGALDFAKQHFQSYSLLRFRLQRLGSHAEGSPAEGGAGAKPASETKPPERAWEITRLVLERLRDSAREAGGRLVVVAGSTQGPDMTARLSGACRELGIPLHSVVPAIASATAPLFYHHDGHLRSRGNAIVAASIAEFLATRGIQADSTGEAASKTVSGTSP